MADSDCGDSRAHTDLYACCNQAVQRLARKFVIRGEETQDLVHEVYLLARRHISQFHGAAGVNTWLYRIALNRLLDDRRRLRALLPLEPDAMLQPSTSNTATEQLDVREAVARLDGHDQTVLKLRFEDGLDYLSIAKATGMRPGTVSSRLHRACGRLAELLGSGYSRL